MVQNYFINVTFLFWHCFHQQYCGQSLSTPSFIPTKYFINFKFIQAHLTVDPFPSTGRKLNRKNPSTPTNAFKYTNSKIFSYFPRTAAGRNEILSFFRARQQLAETLTRFGEFTAFENVNLWLYRNTHTRAQPQMKD